MSPSGDPVIDRRARIARGVSLAKRLGYTMLLGAVVLFAIAAATDFPSGVLTATVVLLVGACLVLPIPIVMGYGLRAAEREDRERGVGPGASGEPFGPSQ